MNTRSIFALVQPSWEVESRTKSREIPLPRLNLRPMSMNESQFLPRCLYIFLLFFANFEDIYILIHTAIRQPGKRYSVTCAVCCRLLLRLRCLPSMLYDTSQLLILMFSVCCEFQSKTVQVLAGLSSEVKEYFWRFLRAVRQRHQISSDMPSLRLGGTLGPSPAGSSAKCCKQLVQGCQGIVQCSLKLATLLQDSQNTHPKQHPT